MTMDLMRKQRLQDAGIDVDSALERFMNNEALLERFLGKFPADPNHDRLVQAIAAGDREGALTAAHTMKGVCGNLSMTALFELLTRQVAAFRADDWDGAVAMMPELDRMYDGLCAAIAS